MALRSSRVNEGDITGDPTEEVGPDECDPKPGDCEVPVGNLEETADGSHPKFSEELLEAFDPEYEVMVPHPEDGLPSPAGESADPVLAPDFHYDTVVCIEDNRQYVEIFSGEIPFPDLNDLVRKYAPEAWSPRLPKKPMPMAKLRQKYKFDGTDEERRTFTPDQVQSRWGHDFVVVKVDDVEALLLVRPVRPVCEFYKCQVFSNDSVPDPSEPGHKIVFRNCAARRSVGGAYMSLRDEAVYSCQWRSPLDPRSNERHIEAPDRQRLVSASKLRRSSK